MKHLSPHEAYAYLSATPEVLFIDCRSEAEYFLVGHPIVERDGIEPLRPKHVWWADEIRLEMNERFVEDVARVVDAKDRPIVLICRSGRRSVSAGEALEAAGWREVYNVLEGFEGPLDDRDRRSSLGGWRQAGLPWEQL